MIVIEIIQYGLGILIMILLSYQLILSILALKEKKRITFNSVQNRHFAIVLPPPENGQMMSKTLYSLFGLVYPKNLYDVIVIDANITRETADNARELGAIVLKKKELSRSEEPRELQWAFKQILQGDKSYDAVSVIESGSLVSGNYLDVMNCYLDEGSSVIQGSNLILPQDGFRGDEVGRFDFLLKNLVRPRDRKVPGFNMGLRGNGICFTTQILRDNPWIPDSLTKEIGFGLILQLQDIDIDFAREAIILTETPAKAGVGARKRWGIDRFSIIKRYAFQLFKASLRHKSFSYFKSFLHLITPSLISTLLIAVMISMLNIFMSAVSGWPLSFVWIWAIVALFGMVNISVESYAINTYHRFYKSML